MFLIVLDMLFVVFVYAAFDSAILLKTDFYKHQWIVFSILFRPC